jgi:L-2-hydroxyglutarate oxidase LhgO
MPAEVRQHGVKGAYVGGDWVNIEDCADQFLLKGKETSTSNYKKANSCNNDCSTCPRSRSKHIRAKEDGSYDVIVIGAGCVGSAIARELSKTNNRVLLLEAADDVTQGATKGNSGIVHAGFDDAPGSFRAKFCWPGNQMFPELDKELHFGYQRNGSLVLAKNSEEVEHLKMLKARGETNGVQRLRIIDDIDELFKMEPHLHPETIAALHAPDAGNLIPYEYAIALAENAVDNGVEVRIRRAVVSIEPPDKDELFTLKARYYEPKSYIEKVMTPNKGKKADGMYVNFGSVLCVCLAAILGAFLSVTKKVTRDFSQLQADLSRMDDLVLVGAFAGIVALMLLALFSTASVAPKPAAIAELTEESLAKIAAPHGQGGSEITVEQMAVGGSGCAEVNDGQTVDIETYRTKYIVNCAGCASDKISAMIGDDSFKIKPRLGDYILLNRNQGHLTSNTLFPCPSKLGKGVLVQTTLWGNLILGPTARDTYLPDVMAETAEDIQTFILSKCKALVPTFDPTEVIHAFRGARAKSTRGDWIIEPSAKHAHFIHAAGIDSPGLAGSPAIALEVKRLLAEAGLPLEANPTFNPYRQPIIVPKDGWKGLKAGKAGGEKVNIVCKCEKVTEEEIVTAMHRSLPIDSTQAIRKRTRAGMGHCQADVENYNCEARVAAIIARENSKKGIFITKGSLLEQAKSLEHLLSPQTLPVDLVGRRPWPATSTLPQRWPTVAEKAKFKEYMARPE